MGRPCKYNNVLAQDIDDMKLVLESLFTRVEQKGRLSAVYFLLVDIS